MHSDSRSGPPSKAEVLADCERRDLQEVLEFTAGPDEDWGAALVSWRPTHSLELSSSVRVVISKTTPRAGAILALRDIADLLEEVGSGTRPAAPIFAELARWFVD